MANSNLTAVGGVPELIDAICTFAAANGWTVHRNTLVSGLRTATIRIAGVTDYIHLFNSDTSDHLLRARISIDYNGALAPEDHLKVTPVDTLCDIRVGPIPKVWLFANDDALHIVCAISVGNQYRHIALGALEKAGTYTGGTYYDSSYHPPGSYEALSFDYASRPLFSTTNTGPNAGFVHADCTLDSRVDFFHQFVDGIGVGANAQWPYPSSSQDGLMGRLIKCADQNTFSGRSVFQPIRVYVGRVGSPVYMSPAGTVVASRFASLAKLDPEQEVIIGGDTWQVFPLARKKAESTVFDPSGTSEAASGVFGLAVLKTS